MSAFLCAVLHVSVSEHRRERVWCTCVGRRTGQMGSDAPEWAFCGNRTFLDVESSNDPIEWFDVWQYVYPHTPLLPLMCLPNYAIWIIIGVCRLAMMSPERLCVCGMSVGVCVCDRGMGVCVGVRVCVGEPLHNGYYDGCPWDVCVVPSTLPWVLVRPYAHSRSAIT